MSNVNYTNPKEFLEFLESIENGYHNGSTAEQIRISKMKTDIEDFLSSEEIEYGIKIIDNTIYYLKEDNLSSKIYSLENPIMTNYDKTYTLEADSMYSYIQNMNNRFYVRISRLVLEYLKSTYKTNYEIFDKYIDLLSEVSNEEYKYSYKYGKQTRYYYGSMIYVDGKYVPFKHTYESVFLSLLVYEIFKDFPNDYQNELTISDYIERNIGIRIKDIIDILCKNKSNVVNTQLDKEINPILFSDEWKKYKFRIITYQGKANSNVRRIRFVSESVDCSPKFLQHTIQINNANVTSEDDTKYGAMASKLRNEYLRKEYFMIRILPKDFNTTKFFLKIPDGLYISYMGQIREYLSKEIPNNFILKHIHNISDIFTSRYNDNTNKKTFDTITVRIGVISRGLSREELLKEIRNHKDILDKIVIEELSNSRVFKKFGIPVSFLKTYDISLTHDGFLDYVFQLKTEEKEEAN